MANLRISVAPLHNQGIRAGTTLLRMPLHEALRQARLFGHDAVLPEPVMHYEHPLQFLNGAVTLLKHGPSDTPVGALFNAGHFRSADARADLADTVEALAAEGVPTGMLSRMPSGIRVANWDPATQRRLPGLDHYLDLRPVPGQSSIDPWLRSALRQVPGVTMLDMRADPLHDPNVVRSFGDYTATRETTLPSDDPQVLLAGINEMVSRLGLQTNANGLYTIANPTGPGRIPVSVQDLSTPEGFNGLLGSLIYRTELPVADPRNQALVINQAVPGE